MGNNKNIRRLGDIVDGRMKKTASSASNSQMVELGTITEGFNLTTDSIGLIPKGQYMVDLRLTSGGTTTEKSTHKHSGGEHGGHEGGSGYHSHDGGEHVHNLPTRLRGLNIGDRVLVVWAGFEPVVVAIVTSS